MKTKTIYISDDGRRESERKEDIEHYEAVEKLPFPWRKSGDGQLRGIRYNSGVDAANGNRVANFTHQSHERHVLDLATYAHKAEIILSLASDIIDDLTPPLGSNLPDLNHAIKEFSEDYAEWKKLGENYR